MRNHPKDFLEDISPVVLDELAALGVPRDVILIVITLSEKPHGMGGDVAEQGECDHGEEL
ncbi:MAG: hypothetical protein IKD61_06900 [Oscillospiraceae bacterium]|nr:hypothetical protein [Oscillospiraceae bacterium]